MTKSSEQYTSPPEKITKLGGAERLLTTAIELFFEERDMLSIHALAAGSHEVLSALLAKIGTKTGLIRDYDRIRPEMLKEYIRHVNSTQNFLKHADRDPDHILDYYEEETPFLVFDAILVHNKLTGSTRIREFFCFTVWFYLEHPSVVKEGPLADTLLSFKSTNSFSRSHFNEIIKNPSKFQLPI